MFKGVNKCAISCSTVDLNYTHSLNVIEVKEPKTAPSAD